ncbi:MAG TPA: TonB-dependent receptor, partial [Gammaproteobacteria bacterium]|nr:TonB-dependent receptor [Gammaproteobacteria bacterium]
LFISAGALTNQGFFGNVGRTRREGLELNVDGRLRKDGDWFVTYTYLDAAFRNDFAVPSPNNPAAVGGQIFVQAGDRLPLVPSELLKAGIQIPVGKKWTFGGDFLVSSRLFLRGDEGNDVKPIAGYGVVNAHADYKLNDQLRLSLTVDNVLDNEYQTFGVFGEAEDVLGAGFDDTRFLSPSAPRAAWLGVMLKF